MKQNKLQNASITQQSRRFIQHLKFDLYEWKENFPHGNSRDSNSPTNHVRAQFSHKTTRKVSATVVQSEPKLEAAPNVAVFAHCYTVRTVFLTLKRHVDHPTAVQSRAC
jgi:hypothetical protein